MIPEFLVTHSGGFHADELLSSVVLTRLFPQAVIVRSRAPEWITPGANRIIYDVGGAYDAEAGIFDHHQRGAPLRDDGQPYSSFGLIWKHFGHDYLAAIGLPEAHIEPVYASLDESFVLPIDLMDNGAMSPAVAGPLAVLTLPVLLETLKPVFDETDPEALERAFGDALTIARSFLEARIAGSAAKLRAEDLVLQAISTAGENRVLELPMGMPFRPAIMKAGADHLLFVVHPRDKDWCRTLICLITEVRGGRTSSCEGVIRRRRRSFDSNARARFRAGKRFSIRSETTTIIRCSFTSMGSSNGITASG